jgi:hypothetical protein
MKKKKLTPKTFTPMSAVAAGFALAAAGAHAQTTPVFSATFPASWNGTGTVVTDQSGAGNTGFQSGTTGATYTTATVPPGAAGGTGSMALNGAAGIKVTPTALLNNTAIANDGGFTYNIDFLWNGTATPATQKLVDYAGTESLQLTGLIANTSATLGMAFGGDTGTAPDNDVVTTTILPDVWYNVTMTFNTDGASLGGTGDITGVASLYVNGALISSAAATKGTYGDSLNRPIAIGELAYGHTTSILGLTGDIYSASVDLGVAPVPEPSSAALGLLGGLGGLGMVWKARRRKT